MGNPELHGLDDHRVWDTNLAFEQLKSLGQTETKRTAERLLHKLAILPPELTADGLLDEQGRRPTQRVLDWEISEARKQRRLVLFCQQAKLPGGQPCLHANDSRGARFWLPLSVDHVTPVDISNALALLQRHIAKPITVFPSGHLTEICRQLPSSQSIQLGILACPPVLTLMSGASKHSPQAGAIPGLDRLESESIEIIREALAEAENPAMLYAAGKDSSVMLHLARKAFYPSPPPLPLLHLDTAGQLQEMRLIRDYMAQESGMALQVHINPETVDHNVVPLNHRSMLHTDITNTKAFKQALDQYKFDVIFDGARRDEASSLANVPVFSVCTKTQECVSTIQRTNLWNLHNAQKKPGQCIRVCPLSNWTELDIWQYILREQIPVVSLYFAKERPVVVRDGKILLVDDDHFFLLPGEQIERRKIRIRSLGRYPFTGAIESSADIIPAILSELLPSRQPQQKARNRSADPHTTRQMNRREGSFP